VVLLYFPYKSLGEVKFGSFVQEILSKDKSDSIFLTKTYILNTIKPFSGHENRPLGLKQQNLKNLS
jgi:hypothetical protein